MYLLLKSVLNSCFLRIFAALLSSKSQLGKRCPRHRSHKATRSVILGFKIKITYVFTQWKGLFYEKPCQIQIRARSKWESEIQPEFAAIAVCAPRRKGSLAAILVVSSPQRDYWQDTFIHTNENYFRDYLLPDGDLSHVCARFRTKYTKVLHTSRRLALRLLTRRIHSYQREWSDGDLIHVFARFRTFTVG